MSDQSQQGGPGSKDLREFLPVSEVAGRVGLSAVTVRRRLSNRDWPSGRCGRKLLIPRAFVDGLVHAMKSGPQTVAEEFAAEWMAREAEAVA